MNAYLKFAAQVVATIAVALYAALNDGSVSLAEAVNILIVGLGAVAVLGAGNLPSGVWAYTKVIVAAATAGAVFIASVITTGGTLGAAEWIQFALAVAGAAGVYRVNGPVVVESTTVRATDKLR